MNITTISLKRIKNLGNYESETIEITVLVDGDETADELLERMREWTAEKLGITRPPRTAPAARQQPAPAATVQRATPTVDDRLAVWLVAQGVDSGEHAGYGIMDEWLRKATDGVGIAEFRGAPEAQRDEIMKLVEHAATVEWLASKLKQATA